MELPDFGGVNRLWRGGADGELVRGKRVNSYQPSKTALKKQEVWLRGRYLNSYTGSGRNPSHKRLKLAGTFLPW